MKVEFKQLQTRRTNLIEITEKLNQKERKIGQCARKGK